MVIVVVVVNPKVKFCDKNINIIFGKVSYTYNEFIDEKGLNYNGLLHIYNDGGGMNRDLDVFGLKPMER